MEYEDDTKCRKFTILFPGDLILCEGIDDMYVRRVEHIHGNTVYLSFIRRPSTGYRYEWPGGVTDLYETHHLVERAALQI